MAKLIQYDNEVFMVESEQTLIRFDGTPITNYGHGEVIGEVPNLYAWQRDPEKYCDFNEVYLDYPGSLHSHMCIIPLWKRSK